MTVFEPFYLDSVKIPSSLVLAPLYRVTDWAFRTLIQELGAPGLTVSEVVLSTELISNSEKVKKFIKSSGVAPYSIQLAGNDPEVIKDCPSICEEAGANLIDFNLGCPGTFLTDFNLGSALLNDQKLVEKCLISLRTSAKVPITVKMRLGWNDASIYLNYLPMFADLGIAGVTIHGRTRNQFYRDTANWKAIKTAVESTKLPIVGNGDIQTLAGAIEKKKYSNCAAVMIGRGAVFNPFIFSSVIVTEQMKIDAAIRYFELLFSFWELDEALARGTKISAFFSDSIDFSFLMNSSDPASDIFQYLLELRSKK